MEGGKVCKSHAIFLALNLTIHLNQRARLYPIKLYWGHREKQLSSRTGLLQCADTVAKEIKVASEPD